ncbi:protein ZNRD2-like [Pollicipes pollicipes]|uniref:protein ZNRD2-like n=1 Tax=Pollicipes pollicipes TaxID=41117 RepID=UPI00188511AF|nr:protein ZNRD2-like [Pollicipes pollicipes]XP_037092036.1 protein ZNRD2-like [Pollicipes pollicipes]XP_037092045.1 protein ZNRD2-like [Pollicipes pollicipes]XP_037092053.1 protein ZNRD2-like [Pollicipes pollicipes]XP_037092061.1 protein ZNRD2-like [Pollicipes pollicipes]XP_037092071.1 protein ZNRD2-like [Pollicipes pollicipes]XP_037092081.1 protein ZNRD2-like [Pollicipes pollicipes]XP_037092087.1 protein ZNRD2-like [Pollicipes pollicipes]XP_037092093.1 protein ZNRD2-like [Pollicipes polli
MDDDLDWSPPSEAEMKVIQAKRERADKISSLMGSYLLKGYKMLNETCPKCTTIYLRDKQDELYCVACVEVDADTEKDNPASSAEAARRQVAESQFSSPRPARAGAAAASPASGGGAAEAAPLRRPVGDGDPRPAAGEDPRPAGAAALQQPGTEDDAVRAAAAAVRSRLTWAASQLDSCASVEASAQLVGLIRACAEALHALR